MPGQVMYSPQTAEGNLPTCIELPSLSYPHTSTPPTNPDEENEVVDVSEKSVKTYEHKIKRQLTHP